MILVLIGGVVRLFTILPVTTIVVHMVCKPSHSYIYMYVGAICV